MLAVGPAPPAEILYLLIKWIVAKGTKIIKNVVRRDVWITLHNFSAFSHAIFRTYETRRSLFYRLNHYDVMNGMDMVWRLGGTLSASRVTKIKCFFIVSASDFMLQTNFKHIFIPYCSLLKRTLCLKDQRVRIIFPSIQHYHYKPSSNLCAKFMSHFECTPTEFQSANFNYIPANSRCHPIRKQFCDAIQCCCLLVKSVAMKLQSKFTVHTTSHAQN